MSTSLKIDDDLKGRIQDLASRRQRSSHWIMREAIEQYVQREETREGFEREAMAAWTDYKETGLHLSGEEVNAWLGTWGTDVAAEPPECHK